MRRPPPLTLPSLLAVGISAVLVACDRKCGLHLITQVTVRSEVVGKVACCGGFAARDVTLTGERDSEFDLSNVTSSLQPIDAFLVPTSCAKLFDGQYPGSSPLCSVYIGPTHQGAVSARAVLPNGTYRLIVQAYSANTDPADFLVDVGIWDQRCGSS